VSNRFEQHIDFFFIAPACGNGVKKKIRHITNARLPEITATEKELGTGAHCRGKELFRKSRERTAGERKYGVSPK
jgi:hypothetical protein